MDNNLRNRNRKEPEISFVFLSYLKGSYSRSSVYLDELERDGIQSVLHLELNPNTESIFKQLRAITRKLSGTNVVYVVMSPCHFFVPMLHTLSKSPIVLDAGWPLSDATFRGSIMNHWKFLKSFCIDFLAFQLADRLILESEAQMQRCAKRFLLSKRKLSVVYTGVNERKFEEVVAMCPPELENWSGTGKYVLFRGKYNLESGLERVIEIVTNGFEGYAVICTNKLPFFTLQNPRVLVITRQLTLSEMKFVYQESKFSLSQLSTHPRLRYTIPHKVFEAIYFNSPLMSFGTEAVKEIFRSEKSFLKIPEGASNNQITELMNWAIRNPDVIAASKARMASDVQPELTQAKLASNFRIQALRCIQSSTTES